MLLGIRPAWLPQDASMLALSAVAWLCLFAAIVAAARRMQEQEAIVAAAKKKEQEMELAYVSAPVGLAMLDADLRYVRINKHLADINGFSIDAHIGKSIHEMVPEIAEQAEAPFRQVLATGKPILGIEFQGSVISQPEVLHVWRENVYPIFDSHGKVIGLNIVAEEVTEQKRLHDALQASELRERQRATELDTIMNATPATIWIARDKACTHITGNPESYRMLRLVPGENASASAPEDVMRSRPFPQIADRDGKALAPEQLPMQAAAATGKEIRGTELRFQFDDGEVRYIYGNASPLMNESGEVAGSVAAFMDITAQKRAEQALQAESRRKDEFLAMLAHELRNPLAPIQTGVDLMNLLDIDHPVFIQVKESIGRQLQQLVRMVDDLLEVSRITQGKITLRRETLDCLAVLASAVGIFRDRMRLKEQQLVLDLPQEAAYVDGDPIRLTQIFTNLIDNAVKYTQAGGTITVRAHNSAGLLRVQVSDNGIGMGEEFMPRMFEVFSQSDRALDRAHGGLGLGLSIVKRLVELHGGRIEAASAGIGKGASFAVTLPLAAGASPRVEAEPQTLSQGWRCKVLVVDDNADVANSIALLLQMKGCDVQKAFNGNDALRLAPSIEADLVLLDIGLPDIDGYRLARYLRDLPSLQHAVFAAVSGYGQQRDRDKGLASGFDFYLTKPVGAAALEQLMRATSSVTSASASTSAFGA